MLQRWSVYWREKDFAMDSGQFNGGRMIMLIWSVAWRENSHVMEVASFNGGSMFMLHRWSV